MTFCIITHVPHTLSNGSYFAYAPYVNEMNIWLQHVDKVIVVAPLSNFEKQAIHAHYSHDSIEFINVPAFSLTSFKAVLKTLFHLPHLIYSIFKAMQQSDHIHLRCPGNMGLLGCIVQILFPNKRKTAKYAGNWDSNSKQPFTYRLQKRILSNSFLTRNISVLVYGAWENQSQNIKSFFTATYDEAEKLEISTKSLNETVHFLFVGSLTSGKNPLEAIKIVEALRKNGHQVTLSLYGDGAEKLHCLAYLEKHDLSSFIKMYQSIAKSDLKTVYQNSHFLVLPSKSEGWPKVVAEAMFWGSLPVVTPISCVPDMLDYGNRGILISNNFTATISEIEGVLKNQSLYDSKINAAISWSRNFTIDTFDSEIKQLLTS